MPRLRKGWAGRPVTRCTRATRSGSIHWQPNCGSSGGARRMDWGSAAISRWGGLVDPAPSSLPHPPRWPAPTSRASLPQPVLPPLPPQRPPIPVVSSTHLPHELVVINLAISAAAHIPGCHHLQSGTRTGGWDGTHGARWGGWPGGGHPRLAGGWDRQRQPRQRADVMHQRDRQSVTAVYISAPRVQQPPCALPPAARPPAGRRAIATRAASIHAPTVQQ